MDCAFILSAVAYDCDRAGHPKKRGKRHGAHDLRQPAHATGRATLGLGLHLGVTGNRKVGDVGAVDDADKLAISQNRNLLQVML